jgi:hypothetical protein
MDKFKNLHIIAVTAQARIGDKQRLIASVADGYEARPKNLDSLIIFIK